MGGFLGVPGSNPGSPIFRYSGEVVLSEVVPEGWWDSWCPKEQGNRYRATLGQLGIVAKALHSPLNNPLDKSRWRFKQIPMKKTILALALVAGLTLYTGNAKAAIIVTTLNEDMTKFSIFSYQISQNSVTGANPGEGFSVGGYNANNYQQGYYFSGGMSFVQTGAEYWDGYYNFYKMSSSLLQLGSTIDGSTSFKRNDYDYNMGNPFTGKIYQGFRADVEGNTYYGYIQGTGNGGTTWTLDSISFNSTPGASVTVTDTTEAIPEPSAFSLLAVGLGGWAMIRRRRS